MRNFLTFTGTGRLGLRGPLFHATLGGDLTANSGVLYFADLVSKRIIDLEDPTIADLVDTTLLRSQNLSIAAKFQNRFLDSLTIQNMRVVLGSDVWLRSNEANIQLGGEVRLSKTEKTYTPSGTLDALRGSYTLHIGPDHPGLHGRPGIGSILRRSQCRPGHSGNPRRSRRPG